MKQSETVIIKRSQIKFNPNNIKRHSEAQVKQQTQNIKRNGFLGGVVYNALSGNLLDGHRRVQSLDLINKYDGTPETDYDIKVEKVEFDRKTELEQMSFMAVANSKADYNLIADFIDEIEYRNIGITEQDYKAIMDLRIDEDFGEMEIHTEGLIAAPKMPVDTLPRTELTNEEIIKMHDEKPKMTKEQVKAEKAHCDDVASNRYNENDLFIVMSFDTYDEKLAFCETFGIEEKANMVIKGKDILSSID